MIQFWQKLLRAHNRVGLTLPFLIGAMRTPVASTMIDEEQNIADVKALLTSIRDDTYDESYVVLNICGNLKQPVFTENSYSPKKMQKTKKMGSSLAITHPV